MRYKINEKEFNGADSITLDLLYKQGIENPVEYTQANTLHDFNLIRNMEKGVKLFHRKMKQKIGIVVDDDCDGFCASGILYDYLCYGLWLTDTMYHIHDGKKHGLDETVVQWVKDNKINLLIVPDAHCDIELCKTIKEDLGCSILVLDHHGSEEENKYAVVINPNYMPKKNTYPNTYLSGCGVTWKFLQALDVEFNLTLSQGYTDLVALSIVSDVMSIKNLENRTIVNMGLEQINNKTGSEFLIKLVEANSFSIKENVTAKDYGWSIAPSINAICRIGTVEEKDVLFKAFSNQEQMYDYKKNKNTDMIQEDVYTRAIRLSKNAHARQKKLRDTDVSYLNYMIQEGNLDKNKIIIVNGNNNVTKGLTGLSAMKLADQYKKPTLVVNPCFRKEDIVSNLDIEAGKDILEFSETESTCYLSGSGRNFDDSYIEDLKTTLRDTELFAYADGHNSAMGVSFKEDNLDNIIEKINNQFVDLEDYCIPVEKEFKAEDIDVYTAMELKKYASMYAINDIKTPKFLVKNIFVNISQVSIVGKNSNTVTFSINEEDDVFVYMFSLPEDDEILSLANSMSDDKFYINAIGTFNTFMGTDSIIHQFIVSDYEIVKENQLEEDDPWS